jgi:hypothetical protein
MSLTSVCDELLSDVISYFGMVGVDLPARQYVAAGVPAWDCELLAVYVVGLAPGDLAGLTTGDISFQDGISYGLRNATIAITIVRCAPKPHVAGSKVTPPTVAEEEAAADALHLDADTIDAAVLSSSLTGCQMIAPVSWNPIGPQGGFVGGEWRYRFSLEDGS